MRSRPRSPVLRTSGSRATAAALTRPGMPARCPPILRASRARCRSTIRARAPGGLLALDLDPGRRGDVDHQAAELGQLLERLGARYVADVSPSGGRHVLILFSSSLPWRELRDLARALSQRFPVIDPAPMSSLGGQISPPGARHKSGGWRVLSMPLSEATAAVEHPNGPEVWAALLTELAAELRSVDRSLAIPDLGRAPSWTTPASRGCPASAAAPRSALSLSTSPAPDGGTGHATRAAARRAWPSWAPP